MNADPQELEKFSALAHRWWDPESEFKPLHQINPLRLDWIDAQAPLKGRRVLDVGCRSEEHTSELQSLAYLVCRLLLEKKKKQEKITEFHRRELESQPAYL